MSTCERASPAGLPLPPELLKEVGIHGHRVQQETVGASLCSLGSRLKTHCQRL